MAKTASNQKEPDYNEAINKFKDDIKSQAENLVLKTFPKKALELHKLLESSQFNMKNLEKIKHEINIPIPEYPYVTPVQSKMITLNHHHEDLMADSCKDDKDDCSIQASVNVTANNNDASSSSSSCSSSASIEMNGPTNTSNKKRKYLVLCEEEQSSNQIEANTKINNMKNCDSKGIDGSRVLILPYGSVSCNKHIVHLIDIVKPLIRQLVDDTNLLKMWVLFLIPRIEDGNNFGVSIQEDTLAEIRTVEAEAASYFDQMSRYFLARAKIITKIAKYPHVDDFRRNVSEIDEKEFFSLRLIVAELRNHYASLHDVVTKNLEKIKTPRSHNQNYAL